MTTMPTISLTDTTAPSASSLPSNKLAVFTKAGQSFLNITFAHSCLVSNSTQNEATSKVLLGTDRLFVWREKPIEFANQNSFDM